MKSKDMTEEKDKRLSEREKKDRQIEMLLATMWNFYKQGKDEVSISEFQESILEFQKEFPELGYTYSNRFLYSLDVLTDLKELSHNGYIRQYVYRHDAFLPKRFITLAPLGKSRGVKILDTLSRDESQGLKRAVEKAIKNYNNRWRLWSR